MSGRITFALYSNGKMKNAFHFDTNEVVLGRQSKDSIDTGLARDMKISRQHARIYRHIGAWWIEDLDSTNGTELNNRPVTKATQLEPGDWLRLGSTVLQVIFEVEENEIGQGFTECHLAVDEANTPPGITPNQSLEVLSIISQISATSSGQVLLDNYLREMFLCFPQARRCSIVLVEDTELITRAFGPGSIAGVSYFLGRKAINTKEAFCWTRSIDFSSDLKKHSSLDDVASAIYAPMICANEVVGVLHMDSTITEMVFSKEDVALLSLLANTMAPAIAHYRTSSHDRLHNIYLSYIDKDREFVGRIAKHLRKKSIKVWFSEQIKLGDSLQEVTKAAIRNTDAFLVINPFTTAPEEKMFRELRIAQSYGKTIVPLAHQEAAKPIIKEVQDIQPLYIGESDFNSSIDQLASFIKDLPFSEQNIPLKSIRILFLAANPIDAIRLRTDEEYRRIKKRLESVELRERFRIEAEFAVRDSDLSNALYRYEPDIVHFSGHGDEEGNIILEDELGGSHPVSPASLRNLFSKHNSHVRCVILNTCSSEIPVRAICQEIECAIGMSQTITDKAAIAFSRGFYEAIGYGRDVLRAFEAGCNAIERSLIEQSDVPQLFTKEGVSAAQIVFPS